MSNFIVGLTGGIGSGKTTVANMFADLGITLVDADVVARDVVKPESYALTEIVNRFGKGFVLPTGFLDRAKLRQKIFSSEADKQWLNNLLHPLIRQSVVEQLTNNTDGYCILVAPLLLENNLVSYVNRVLVIDVDESIQIERTLKRDNTDSKTVKSIISSQISRKERLEAADDIIDNSTTTLNDIQQQVAALHKSYLALSSART